MKNLTISLPDDLYRRARSKAAAETSLSRVVQNLLASWATEEQAKAELMARLDALFTESDARDHDKPGSAGPFPREELYADHLERFR